MKIKIYILLLIAICFFNNLKAQTLRIKPTCGSVFNLQEVKKTDPERYMRFLKMEQQIERYKAQMQTDPKGRLINSTSVIIIPVVVHVLHHSETLGTGNNLSFAMIQSQIDVLNEDFRRLNADASNTPSAFTSAAADTRFEFRLACVDPAGNPTDGIDRVPTSVTTFYVTLSGSVINETATKIKDASLGGADYWPSDKYLNIWTCQLGGLFEGYGTFPEDQSTHPEWDGIVVYSELFGSPSGLSRIGRTATHEVGHWLGLRHIWGDDGTACTGTDFCADTPNQAGPTSTPYGCPSFPLLDACSTTSPGIMYMNYMDYSDDNCKNMFTNDQATRMRDNFYGGLKESFIENYFNVIQPTASICNTGTVSVKNLSCLSPVTWTVLSGPASIIGGQGTNTVTLQSTGDGTAVIQASAGGYIDEKNVSMGAQTPGNIIGIDYPTAVLSGQTLELYADNINMASYSWSVVGGTISGASNQDHLIVTTDFCYPPLYNSYLNVYLTYTNACGTGSEYGEWTYVLCGEGGGGPLRIVVIPNPVKDFINISIEGGKKISTSQSVGRTQIKLYDVVTNSLVRQWNFSDEQKEYKLRIQGVKAGHYIIEVTKGNEKQTKHLMIE